MPLTRVLFAALVLAFTALIPAAHAVPAFGNDGPLVSDSGNAQIDWEGEGEVTLELVQGDEVRPLYRGTNDGFFLTGLAVGEYELRLTDETGATAVSMTLNVVHQPLSRALWLVGLGAIVFLMTVGAILRGARDD